MPEEATIRLPAPLRHGERPAASDRTETGVRRWLGETRAFLQRYVLHSDGTPEEERAFEAYSRDLTVRSIKILLMFCIVANMLVWPFDFFLFRAEPEVLVRFHWWRSGVTLIWILGYGIFDSPRLRTSTPLLALAIGTGAACCAAIGAYNVGAVGGFEYPFFYSCFTFAGLTAPVFLHVGWRALVALAFNAAFMAAYLKPWPDNANYPYIPQILQILVGANIGYLILGQALCHLVRINFFQAQALKEASDKSERLLLNVLPAAIAARLKESRKPIADAFPEVTVLFADIVGFTSMSARLPPEQIVALLNRIFTAFDHAAERLGLEKIKTIGDAYMVAGGLPAPRDDHAQAVAEMALSMLDVVASLQKEGADVRLRIGIHTGPVVAGVIGSRKFIYDLWGDTVNTASRMESHGVPGEIQVTHETYLQLSEAFEFEARGEIDVKGKGRMPVYLLRRRRALAA